MTVVAVFLGLGAVLVGLGLWGRRNAGSLGVVPGMPEDLVEHRVGVLRRGATACFTLGGMFLVLGIAAPFL